MYHLKRTFKIKKYLIITLKFSKVMAVLPNWASVAY